MTPIYLFNYHSNHPLFRIFVTVKQVYSMPLKHGSYLLASELVLLTVFIPKMLLPILTDYSKALLLPEKIKFSTLWNFPEFYLLAQLFLPPVNYSTDMIQVNMKIHHMLTCEYCILNYCFLILFFDMYFASSTRKVP